jgi:hypothetical protein
MKKQKLNSISLRLKKVSIAHVTSLKGQANGQPAEPTNNTLCCSEFPYCEDTLTTRPDSFNPKDNKNNEPG